MLLAMLGVMIFGAMLVIPRWLKIVAEGGAGPTVHNAREGLFRRPPATRTMAPTVRQSRRPHGPGRSRGNNAHHAGL